MHPRLAVFNEALGNMVVPSAVLRRREGWRPRPRLRHHRDAKTARRALARRRLEGGEVLDHQSSRANVLRGRPLDIDIGRWESSRWGDGPGAEGRARRGTVTAAADVGGAVCYRDHQLGVLYYAFPVLADSVSADTGWSRATTTAAFSVSLLVAAGIGVPVGRMLDRFGPHQSYGRLARRVGRGRRHRVFLQACLSSSRGGCSRA